MNSTPQGTPVRPHSLASFAFAGLAGAFLFTPAGLAQEPQIAATINPYPVLDQTRDELTRRYPGLSSREVDLLVFRTADIRSVEDKDAAGPAGDWFCLTGSGQVVLLSMRAKSYFINRPGQAMGGEYQYAGTDVMISSGPLRGMGIAEGTFARDWSPRLLEFRAAEGVGLSCKEVL